MKHMRTVLTIVFLLLLAFELTLLFAPGLFEPLSADSAVYSGKEEHTISMHEATLLTGRMRVEMSSLAVVAQYFGRNAFEKTLTQPGCVGIRVYYGRHNDGSPALVMVGVDRHGRDLTSGIISQRSYPCPPWCDDDSRLNSKPQFTTLP